MKNINYKVFLILIPLGSFIYFLDDKISEKSFFLETSNHYYILGVLIFVVSILLFLIIKMDNNSNQK